MLLSEILLSSENNLLFITGKKIDKSKKNKKPEREIYQPGHRLRNQRMPNSLEDTEDTRNIQDRDSPEDHSKHELSQQDDFKKDQSVQEVQSKMQDLELMSQVLTSGDEHSEPDMSSGVKQGRRKQKRPDQQIYRPRIVQQHAETLGEKEDYKVVENMDVNEIQANQKHTPAEEPGRRPENCLARNVQDDMPPPSDDHGGDLGRFARAPRQMARSHRPGRGKDAHVQKSHSLDWEDGCSFDDDPTVSGSNVNECGWGTDYGKDEEVGHENMETKRGRRKRRERRSSGQKHCDNRRTALPKQHSHGDRHPGKPETSKCEDYHNPIRNTVIPDQQPKITSDDNIAQSINKGMFQGMVFTNSRMSDDCLDSTNHNINVEVPQPRQQKLAQDQRKSTEKAKGRELTYQSHSNGVSDSEKDSVMPTPGADDSKDLTWNEQVEVAEVEERRRLTAVIESRERKMTGQRKGHDSRSRGARKDNDRQSDLDDGRNRAKHNSREQNQHKSDKNKAVKDHGKKNISLKVTFASGKEQRKVVIPEHEKSSSEEKELEGSMTECSVNGPSKVGRGGLIKLPMSAIMDDSVMQHSMQGNVSSVSQHHHHRGAGQHHRGRGRGQGRGAGHRALYDPKNPNKPVPVSSASQSLHFFDPADQAQNSPPTHPVPYFPDQFSCNYASGEYSNIVPNYHEYNCPGPQPAPYYGMPPAGIQPIPVLPPFYDRNAIRHDECGRELYERR